MSGLLSWSFFELASVRREMKLATAALEATMKLAYIEVIVAAAENGDVTDEAAMKRITAVIRLGRGEGDKGAPEEAPKGAPEDGQT